MFGGIALLGIIGLATEMLSKYGLEALLIGIYRQRIQNGESHAGIERNPPITTIWRFEAEAWGRVWVLVNMR